MVYEHLPPPLPSEGERNCGGSRGPWQDGEKCWRQHIGGSERSVLTRRDPGQVALPHPPHFPNKSPLSSPLHFMSTSKSSTRSLVSSVPLRLPTAQTSLVLEARMRQTTPPLPPLSSVTRLRINSPVRRSHNFTVPSSELVMTKFLLNCRHVTALWCLWGPENKIKETEVKKVVINLY